RPRGIDPRLPAGRGGDAVDRHDCPRDKRRWAAIALRAMSALTNWLTHSQDFFLNLGWLGVLLYAGAIGLLGGVCVPLSPVAAAGGAMFGFWGGFVAVTIGTALAAVLNFLISRYLLRGPIERRLARNEKFRLIDMAIGREGWKIVALLRFVPM